MTLVHIRGFPLGFSSSDDSELLDDETEASADGVQLVGSVVYFMVALEDELFLIRISLIILGKVTFLAAAKVTKGISAAEVEIPIVP